MAHTPASKPTRLVAKTTAQITHEKLLNCLLVGGCLEVEASEHVGEVDVDGCSSLVLIGAINEQDLNGVGLEESANEDRVGTTVLLWLVKSNWASEFDLNRCGHNGIGQRVEVLAESRVSELSAGLADSNNSRRSNVLNGQAQLDGSARDALEHVLLQLPAAVTNCSLLSLTLAGLSDD